MLDLVKDTLYRFASPEMGYLIEEADKAIIKSGIVSIETPLSEIIDNASNEDEVNLPYQIQSVYSEFLLKLVHIHGIRVNDLGLKELTDIVNGINLIQDYEDTERISQICDSESDSIERFCNLLSLVTEHDPVYMETWFQSVNPLLLLKIYDLVEPELETVDYSLSIHQPELIKRVKDWVIYKPESVAAIYVQNGILPLLEVGTYVDILPAEVMGKMRDNVEYAAETILGIVFISNTTNDDISETITALLDQVFGEINTISNIFNHIYRLINGMKHG